MFMFLGPWVCVPWNTAIGSADSGIVALEVRAATPPPTPWLQPFEVQLCRGDRWVSAPLRWVEGALPRGVARLPGFLPVRGLRLHLPVGEEHLQAWVQFRVLPEPKYALLQSLLQPGEWSLDLDVLAWLDAAPVTQLPAPPSRGLLEDAGP